MEQFARELAESFVCGNQSHVCEEITAWAQGKNPLEIVLLTLHIVDRLPSRAEQESFMRAVQHRA